MKGQPIQVIGDSSRQPNSFGWTAWLYGDGSTVNVGLTDSAHTDATAYRQSNAPRLNESGQVAGSSQSYIPGVSRVADSGNSVWLWGNGVTMNISLTGREPTRFDGKPESTWVDISEAAEVIGYYS